MDGFAFTLSFFKMAHTTYVGDSHLFAIHNGDLSGEITIGDGSHDTIEGTLDQFAELIEHLKEVRSEHQRITRHPKPDERQTR